MKFRNPIIAHRGAWKESGFPENSLAAFRKAFEMKCGGVELDIHFTLDHEIVIEHNPFYHHLEIEKTSYTDLSKFLLSNGEPLPRLKDFLDMASHFQESVAVIELKSCSTISKTKEFVDHLRRQMKEYQLKIEVIFIFFDWEAALYMKACEPQNIVLYLEGDLTPEVVDQSGLDGCNYPLSVFLEHPEYIQDAKKLHQLVGCWTVNDFRDVPDLWAHGEILVTTDYPKEFLRHYQLGRNSS